jgi:hypothetical protein
VTPRTARMVAKGGRRLLVLFGSFAVLGFGTAGAARADEPCPPTDTSCLSAVGDSGDDTLKIVTEKTVQVSGQANETTQQGEDRAAAAVQTVQDTVQTVEDKAQALVDDLLGKGGKDPGDGDRLPGGGDGGTGGHRTGDGGDKRPAHEHRAEANGGSTRGAGLLPTPGAGGEVQGVLPQAPTDDPAFGRTVAGLAFHLILPLCLLAGFALLFVALQGQLDRRDPHLAGAPVVRDVVRFE